MESWGQGDQKPERMSMRQGNQWLKSPACLARASCSLRERWRTIMIELGLLPKGSATLKQPMHDQSPSSWSPRPTVPRQPCKGKGRASCKGGIVCRRSPRFTYNGRWPAGPTHLTAMNNSTSPRTIYLPSSGGYTSSRIVPEVR